MEKIGETCKINTDSGKSVLHAKTYHFKRNHRQQIAFYTQVLPTLFVFTSACNPFY